MTTLDEAVARLRAWHQSDDHQHEDPDAFNADLGALLKDHAGLREKLSTSRTTCAYCEAALAAVRLAQEAWGRIIWMAEKYAEAGGRYGPEQRDYDEAVKDFAALDQAFGSGT